MTWVLIWKITFIGVLAAFSFMATLTTVYGARDIKRLLRELNDVEEKTDEG